MTYVYPPLTFPLLRLAGNLPLALAENIFFALLLIGFAVWEYLGIAPNPIIPRARVVLGNRSNVAALAAGAFDCMAFIWSVDAIPLYLQIVRGMKPLQASLNYLPFALVMVASTTVSGWILKAYDVQRGVLRFCVVLTMASLLISGLAFPDAATSASEVGTIPPLVYVGFVLAGLAYGPTYHAPTIALQSGVSFGLSPLHSPR